jgi:hypothetical protein
MPVDDVRDVLGGVPVEFGTASELAALMARLPADTPVVVAHGIRIDPALPGSDMEERTAAAAVAFGLPQLVDVDGRREQQRVPAVQLGAFYAAEGHRVPAATVPAWPYERAVEAIHAGDDDAMFDAFAEMLRFVAGSLDGKEDASFYEHIAGDADLVGQAELDAALLRHAADRLTALHQRVRAYLPN